MKLTLIALGIALCCALVYGEGCRDTSDCDYEHCTGDGWTISCTIGTCTCDHGTHTGSKCTSGADCAGMHCLGGIGGNIGNIGDRFFERHCVDNQCRCTFGGLNGGK